MSELLRLQQQKQLPSEVTADRVIELLVEESKRILTVQLWDFEVEDFDKEDAKPLLQLVWSVNTSMKMRDVEFEARRLLDSPETIPPQFQHPKILTEAKHCAEILMEEQQQQQQKAPKLLCPQDMVLEVVPKVLQGFWLFPRDASFNMPSQQLSKMAVGVTKAVEDGVTAALPSMHRQFPLCDSIRDAVVRLIQRKVALRYTPDGLTKVLNNFAPEVLETVAEIAAREICALFVPQISSKKDGIRRVSTEHKAETTSASPAPDSAAAQTSQPPLTPPAEQPADLTADQTPEPAVSSPPAPLMPKGTRSLLGEDRSLV